jgi:hypothetical protein
MVNGDSLHYNNKCALAQKSSEGHVEQYGMWEARHHMASAHRTRSETGDLGIKPHTNGWGTKTEYKTENIMRNA